MPELNKHVSASAVDWSGDEAAMSLIGSPTDDSFIVTHTPDGSKQHMQARIEAGAEGAPAPLQMGKKEHNLNLNKFFLPDA